ncbi:MAG: hypothetical protein ACKOC9_00690, partial [Alphaproteobacteria bacterium]
MERMRVQQKRRGGIWALGMVVASFKPAIRPGEHYFWHGLLLSIPFLAGAGLDFLQTVNPNASSQWVLGYSFGAYVGMQVLMRRPEMGGFVSIRAPASHYDFGFL